MTHPEAADLPGFSLGFTVQDAYQEGPAQKSYAAMDLICVVVAAAIAKDSLNHWELLRRLGFLAGSARYVPLRYAILQLRGAT